MSKDLENEKFIKNQKLNLGDLLECIRITFGLTQKQMAGIIGVAQSTVSKLEHGEQSLSTFQWCNLAETLKIPIETIKYGFLDSKSNSSINHWRTENGYYVPKIYATDRCIKVRALLPLINYLNVSQGPGYLTSHLKEMVSLRKGVDCFPRSSFFLNLDNQVSLYFWDTLLQRIKADIRINKKTISDISSQGTSFHSHGYLSKSYQKGKDGISLLKQYTLNAPKYQSLITNTLLESTDEKISLSWEINKELEDSFDLRSSFFKNFIESMFTGVFEGLPGFPRRNPGQDLSSSVRIKKFGSLLKDDKKILYEIYAA